MGFVKKLAQGGLFGLGGLAASGAFKDKKKPNPSLISGDSSAISRPSLISRNGEY